jgi:hypothetical protein
MKRVRANRVESGKHAGKHAACVKSGKHAARHGVKSGKCANRGRCWNRANGVLDFRHAGAQGNYMLVKNWRDPAMNLAIDKFIEEADSMRAMSLQECQQG